MIADSSTLCKVLSPISCSAEDLLDAGRGYAEAKCDCSLCSTIGSYPLIRLILLQVSSTNLSSSRDLAVAFCAVILDVSLVRC